MTYSSDSTGSEFRPDSSAGRRALQDGASVLSTAAKAVAGVIAAGEDLVAYVLHWRRARWTVERLSALDDATLRDIGIGRSEIVPTAYRIAQDEWESRRRSRS